jgi:hypothetical protein
MEAIWFQAMNSIIIDGFLSILYNLIERPLEKKLCVYENSIMY